jgi:hypothetical protein
LAGKARVRLSCAVVNCGLMRGEEVNRSQLLPIRLLQLLSLSHDDQSPPSQPFRRHARDVDHGMA